MLTLLITFLAQIMKSSKKSVESILFCFLGFFRGAGYFPALSTPKKATVSLDMGGNSQTMPRHCTFPTMVSNLNPGMSSSDDS